MLELGDASEAQHLGLAESLSSIDHVFCVGQGARSLAQSLKCIWHENADDALLRAIVQTCSPGSTVLVKGSNRVFWANQFVQRLQEALKDL
jgi:UDP-N-acetylmuramyl pentapeptide synthase